MLNKPSRMVAGVGAVMAIVSLTGCGSLASYNKDERSAARVLDDKVITGHVEKSLETEPTYKFSGVNVETYARTVQLSGFVNTDTQKWRAQQLAEHTEGVKQVVNGITIKPTMPTATSRSGEASRIYSAPQSQSSQTN